MMRSVRFSSPLHSLLQGKLGVHFLENGSDSIANFHSFAKPHAHIALIISAVIYPFHSSASCAHYNRGGDHVL